jgi:tRNA-2-methylthio-N6-dimethylallyladenosine synthase
MAENQAQDALIGSMVDIEVTEVLNYTLRGELVKAHAIST